MNSQRARPRLPADDPTFLIVFVVDLAAGKAPRSAGAPIEAGRSVRHPDNDSCQCDENDQRDDITYRLFAWLPYNRFLAA